MSQLFIVTVPWSTRWKFEYIYAWGDTTYQCQTEEILRAAVRVIARTTDYLSFELTLEYLWYESDLLVGERDAAEVAERWLSQVIKQAEQELLSVTLLSELESSISNVLEK